MVKGGFLALAVVLALPGCYSGHGGAPAPVRAQPAPAVGADPMQSAASEAVTADSSAWRGVPAARAEDLIEGRFPGVQVIRLATGDVSIRIRGTSTIMGSGEPLYVIDGQEISAGPGGALVGINPRDIVKIEVLKDVGSTALYGVRGGNGVILITTRRGPQ